MYKFNKMEDYLIEFPENLVYYKNLKKDKLPEFEEINFIGMGGSGIAPKILSPFLKVKHGFISDYSYVDFIDDKALNFLISYSGNTEETLSFVDKLKNKKIIGISSGGKLREFFEKENLIFYELPKGYPPRCALGYMFSLLSFVLEDYISFKINDLDKIKEFLKTFKEKFSSIDGPAMEMAQKFYKRPVLIYTAYPYLYCALRIKTQLNENSKHFVHLDFIPEMNHNEIEGINKPCEIIEKSWVLFIKGKFLYKKNQKRIEETIKIIEDEVMGVSVFEPLGENLLEEMFYTIYFFDWVSIHLAKLNKVNPFEIKRISTLKEALKG